MGYVLPVHGRRAGRQQSVLKACLSFRSASIFSQPTKYLPRHTMMGQDIQHLGRSACLCQILASFWRSKQEGLTPAVGLCAFQNRKLTCDGNVMIESPCRGCGYSTGCQRHKLQRSSGISYCQGWQHGDVPGSGTAGHSCLAKGDEPWIHVWQLSP